MLVVSILVMSSASADALQKKYDDARIALLKKGNADCNSSAARKIYKTIGAREKCFDKYRIEMNERFPLRGSDAYSEKNYAKLTRRDAETKLVELEAISKTAKYSTNSKSGEVSRFSLEREGQWIQKHVLKSKVLLNHPWYIDCSRQDANTSFVKVCPLGKGGEK